MTGGSFLVWLVVAVLTVIPFWKLLPRAGISPYVSLLAAIPVVPLVLLWILAFTTWPGDREKEV